MAQLQAQQREDGGERMISENELKEVLAAMELARKALATEREKVRVMARMLVDEKLKHEALKNYVRGFQS